MATTPAPLVWDSFRSVGAVDGLGGNVHYYDEAAQAIYLHNGITTQITKVEEGHWKDAIYGSEVIVDGTAYTLLSLDHPYNGTLHLTAADGTSLYYLRYVYAMDISDLVETGAWKTQNDNPIAQISLSVHNVSAATFAGDATLFNPGAKLSLSLRLGDSAPYQIGVAFIDQVDFDRTAKTVPISGRNAIGYHLNEQTFDLDNAYTGLSHEIAAAILTLAGLTNYSVEAGEGLIPFTFGFDKTLLAGLKEMFEVYTQWKLVELPDGKILIGRDSYIKTYQSNSYYTFEGEKEVFSRKTSKSADAAYTRVMVTGKDPDGVDHTPVLLPVDNFDFWALGSHKTCHVKAPDGLSAAELATYAADVASRLQYVGIGEDFTGPLRPHLLVGDVAEVYYPGDVEGTSRACDVHHATFRQEGILHRLLGRFWWRGD